MNYAGRVELAAPATPGGSKRVRIQILKTGEWLHEKAPGGRLIINDRVVDTILANFRAEIGGAGKELPTDYHHQDKYFLASKGWIQDIEDTRNEKGERELYGIVDPTAETLKKIEDKEVKYFSSSLDFNFKNPKTGQKTVVLRGGAWTNLPVLKGMNPAEIINLAELKEDDDWADPDSDDDGSGGGSMPQLSSAQDPDAKSDDLPDQCRSCKLLFDGNCPFQPVEVKEAAAGDGNCPRYEAYDASINSPESRKQETLLPDTQLAELQTQLTDLAEKQKETVGTISALEKANKLLAEALDADRNSRIELSEIHRRTSDQRFLVELCEEGRITPAQAPHVEKILNLCRGVSGTIELSELSGSESVDLSTLELADEFQSLMRSIEPQIDLEDARSRGVVSLAEPRRGGGSAGGNTLTAETEKQLVALCAENGKPRSAVGQYGEAARRAAVVLSKGGR